MPSSARTFRFDWFLWTIGPVVFASRWIAMSRPYFADGPALIQAARNATYVIQPPGYWLYAHLGGLFAVPTFGFSLINALASAAGCVIFYLVCLRLTGGLGARLATAAYAAIYFAWFAGCVQSSYAGELLLGPLLLLLMLRYVGSKSISALCGIALSYAAAAGIRPSDGVFLAPAFVYFVVKLVRERAHRIIVLCLAAAACLLWLIPQQIALAASSQNAGAQLWSVAAPEAPILHGFTKLAISNLARVLVPLAIAFWSLLPGIVLSREKQAIRTLLWIWIAPGLAFFALIYISDATYLCFLVPAILLLALTRQLRALSSAGLIVCFVWNLLFFCFARPARDTHNPAVAIYSVSGARYCAWALKHQWYRTLRTYTDVPVIGSEDRLH